MGVPIKVMLDNQPVLLCCIGCESAAKANPVRTLKRVADFKTKTKAVQKGP